MMPLKMKSLVSVKLSRDFFIYSLVLIGKSIA